MPDALLIGDLLSFAFERQLVSASDVNLQVLAVESGQFRLDVDLVRIFPDVDGGECSAHPEQTAAVRAPPVEEPVHFVLEVGKLVEDGVEGLPASDSHDRSPPNFVLECSLVIQSNARP